MNLIDVPRKWAKAQNRRDVDAVVSVYAPNIISYDPMSPAPMKGIDAIRKDAENFFKAFPNMKVKFLNLMTKGNTIMGEVRFTGTNSGPLESPNGTIPATSKRIEMNGAFTARANARGLLVEEHRYYDTASMMRSLGLMK